MPLTAGGQSNYTSTGIAALFDDYTGDGRLRVDTMTDDDSGKISNATPFIVTGADGDQLCFTFLGDLELEDAGNGLVIARWLAEFKPIIGSGSGKFESVSGGSFFLSSQTDPFLPGSATNIVYRWSGEGSLMLVPEPSSCGLLSIAGLFGLGWLRRRLVQG